MSVEPNKIIYSMVGVSKFYNVEDRASRNKLILKDIYISYFCRAKIGVIGLNGSGKSSLLKIFAGVVKNKNGETVVSPCFTIGCPEHIHIEMKLYNDIFNTPILLSFLQL